MKMNIDCSFIRVFFLTIVWQFSNLSTAAAQDYTIAQANIFACNGRFVDAGGASQNYPPNEQHTTTICSGSANTSHVNLIFRNIALAANDVLCFYDGNNTSAPLLGCNADYPVYESFVIRASASNTSGCLTVTFSSDQVGQEKGWLADIFCTQPCQQMIAQLAAATPAPNAQGYIDICPGETVTFSGTGAYPENGTLYEHSDATATFHWDFGDGNKATGKTVTHRFEQAGGYKVQLFIKDARNCSSSNLISQRVRVAERPNIYFDNSIMTQICARDTIKISSNINQTNSMVRAAPVTSTFSGGGVLSDSVGIPDGTGLLYETSIKISDFAVGQTLDNINDLLGVCVNMEHSFIGDLEIKLSCPSGNSVILHEFSNFTGGNLYLGEPILDDDQTGQAPTPGKGFDYCWSPDASRATWLEFNKNNPGAETLPSAQYRAYDDLSNLLGCSLNGDWTISIQDYWGKDNGVIFSWSLQINSDVLPDVEKFTPKIIDYQWKTNDYTFNNTPNLLCAAMPNAGSAAFEFQITDDFGCVYDTLVRVNILPPTHPNCSECNNITIPLADTLVCEGDTIQFDVTIPHTPTQEVIFQNYEIDTIPDRYIENKNYTYISKINVTNINPATINANTIRAVCLKLTHERMDELDVFLQMPDGTLLELTTDNGGNGKGYDLCFSPTATANITSAPTNGLQPVTGTWQPESNWTNLVLGKPTNGTWSLLIADDVENNFSGSLKSWSILFQSENTISYQWTPVEGLSCADCPMPSLAPTANTTYRVEVSDAYGCRAEATSSIFIDPCLPCRLSLQSIDIQPATCATIQNGRLRVQAAGGAVLPIQYKLNNNVTQIDDGNFLNLPFGKHSLYIKDAADCDTTLIFFIDTLRSVQLNVQTFDVQCKDQHSGRALATLHDAALGAVRYAWSHDENLTLPSAIHLEEGKYAVTATDSEGCAAIDSFHIAEPDSLEIVIETTNLLCHNLKTGALHVLPKGGTAPYHYLWREPYLMPTQRQQQLLAGEYVVTVTDARGCTQTATATLTQPPPFQVQLQQHPVSCKGKNDGMAIAQPSGGISPYTFLWNDATRQKQDTARMLPPVSVTLFALDANACPKTATIEIEEPKDSLSFQLQQTKIACHRQKNNEISASVHGGTPPYHYEWSNEGQNVANLQNLDEGLYQLTVTDARACSFVDTISVQAYDTLFATVEVQAASCHAHFDGQALVASVTGGAGGSFPSDYRFLWSTNPSQLTPQANYLQGGNNYAVIVTDKGGCKDTLEVIVPEPSALQVRINQYVADCRSTTANFLSVETNGGTLPYTFLWDTGLTLDTLLHPTNGRNYRVTVTDASGCKSISSMLFSVPSQLSLRLLAKDNLCYGASLGEISASVVGGKMPYSYQWLDDATQNERERRNLASGRYRLTVEDADGCLAIDSIDIKNPMQLVTDIAVTPAQCSSSKNGSILATPSGGTSPYMYSIDGQKYTSNNFLTSLQTGKYQLFVKDIHSCMDTIFDINIFDNQNINLKINAGDSILVVPFNTSIELFADATDAQPPITYEWNVLGASRDTFFDCYTCERTLVQTLKTDARVWVNMTDANGCQAQASVLLDAFQEKPFFVPTAFTPNADSANDRFLVHGKQGTRVLYIHVFDRWGERVFATENCQVNDEACAWDGTFKGEPMNSGIFVWRLALEQLDGTIQTAEGVVHLIR